MESPTFQPSNAGAQLLQQTAGLTEHFQNMYVRAEALKQSQARFEMEQKRFATEQTFAAVDLRAKELQLKKASNDLEKQSYAMEAERKIIDAQKIQAQGEIDESAAAEDLIAQLPSALKGVEQIGVDDYDGLLRAHSDILRRFGHLSQGKYANRFAAVAGPALETLGHRLGTSQILVERSAAEKLFDLRTAMATNDTGALSKLLADPSTRRAALSQGEMGKNLNQQIDLAVKQLVDRQTKLDEEKVKGDSAATVAGAKAAVKSSEQSIPGFEGQVPTKEEAIKLREELPAQEQVLQGLQQIKQLTTDPSFSKFDLKTRQGKIEPIINTLIGALRIPITGPGAMTEAERGFIMDTIGNPTKIFSLSSIEQTKLDTLLTRLDEQMKRRLELLGLKRKQAPEDPAPEGGAFSGQIGGKQVEGTWTVRNGRKGVLTGDGLFYPVRQ